MTAGLSCYTANLYRYMDVESDATRTVAESVRLAVREESGVLAFSHHAPSLDGLPDGSRLRYAGAASAAGLLPNLVEELRRYQRVLVLCDGARLPWSVARRSAPHWLLLDGHRRSEWHAVDDFTAFLLDGGEQPPYRGWLHTDVLCVAMAASSSWTGAQRRRNALAFGSPVSVPEARLLWLRRERGRPDRPEGEPVPARGWAIGDAALDLVAGRLTAPGPTMAEHLDDLWAAAGHRCFAYRWWLSRAEDEATRDRFERALAQWSRLPVVLRIAMESAERGRPRADLVRTALAALMSEGIDENGRAAGHP